MSKTIIVDGFGILFRSFHAISMYNLKGLHIGGVYGFINTILHLIQFYNPEYFIMTFDTKEKTWRHNYQSTYKAQRQDTPAELIHQFDLVRQVCKVFGILYYEGSECEADDWIASCVRSYKDLTKLYVVSTDKDLLQLASDHVTIYDPFRKIEITPSNVIERWGVEASQIVDLLAMTGDASDGIEGIRGIGLKTAAKWLDQYKSLDNIIKNSDSLEPAIRKNAFRSGYMNALEARKMITLRADLPVKALETSKIRPCIVKIKDFFDNHGISLLRHTERILGKTLYNQETIKLF